MMVIKYDHSKVPLQIKRVQILYGMFKVFKERKTINLLSCIM